MAYNSMNLVPSRRFLVVLVTTWKQMQLSPNAIYPLWFLVLRAKPVTCVSLKDNIKGRFSRNNETTDSYCN